MPRRKGRSGSASNRGKGTVAKTNTSVRGENKTETSEETSGSQTTRHPTKSSSQSDVEKEPTSLDSMAKNAETSVTRFDIKDLMQCSMCLQELQHPKALPCLHSFCLKCLSQWAQGKTSVTCPLCVQEFEIPSGGVSSFRTNFFINTLKEREETINIIRSKDAVAPCTSCELLETKIGGYCYGCKGFICEDCVGIHTKIKNLRDHKIIPYVDLQSGKINIKDIYQKQHCKIHEGHVLKFHCETCEVLVCLECTVVDHPATGHTLVNLETAIKAKKAEIKLLTTNCDDVRKEMLRSLKEMNILSEMLVTNATKAEEDIDQAFLNELKKLENNREKLKNGLKTAVTERKKHIDALKDTIQLEQTRLDTTLQMSTEVLQSGSDYDFAQVYSSLKTNLTTMCNYKLGGMNKTLSDISFKPIPTAKSVIHNLGSISTCNESVRALVGVKKMLESICDTGNGKLVGARDVAVTQQSDIFVTDYYDQSIKSYDENGTLKSKTRIDDFPWGIKASHDGRVFVAISDHVNVYDKKLNLQQQFQVKSPNNKSSDILGAALYSLAFDNHNMLLVGECSQKYISKHRLDGSHVMSFTVTIQPHYISVSSRDKIIVSSYIESRVHILSDQGIHLHSIKPPPELSSWNPFGVCCTSNDEVYIVSGTPPLRKTPLGSIHVYSTESGDYIGCLIEGLRFPKSLALNNDELLVVQNESVVIFQLEYID